MARNGSTTQDVIISVSTPETITKQVLINHINELIENPFYPEEGRNNMYIPLSEYKQKKIKP